MTTSLAFEITVPEAALPAFVAAVGRQLQAEVPWSEQALIDVADGRRAGLALGFLFDHDAVLEAFAFDYGDSQPGLPGKVSVGFLFVTARRAAEGIAVCFDSSSRAIVDVMRESISVRGFFLSLAPFSTDGLVFVVDEWNDSSPL